MTHSIRWPSSDFTYNSSTILLCIVVLYHFLELFLDPLTWLFYMLIPVLVQIDCDKTVMVTLKHDDKLQDGSECAFQVGSLNSLILVTRRGLSGIA